MLCRNNKDGKTKRDLLREGERAKEREGKIEADKVLQRVLLTFTKASRTSRACSMLSGVETVSPRVMRVRLVRQFITSFISTCTTTQRITPPLPTTSVSSHTNTSQSPESLSRVHYGCVLRLSSADCHKGAPTSTSLRGLSRDLVHEDRRKILFP